MGGQAANFWAMRYARVEPTLTEIGRIFPFVSKDVDFQGNRAAALALARELGSRADVPSFRRAFGNLMSGQFTLSLGEEQLKIEVLRKVPGLKGAELLRLATHEQSGGYRLRVLNPVGVLLAKTWNVVNISKEGRHDAEQLLAMVPCVRAFIREFLLAGVSDERELRAGLNFDQGDARLYRDSPGCRGGRAVRDRLGPGSSPCPHRRQYAATTEATPGAGRSPVAGEAFNLQTGNSRSLITFAPPRDTRSIRRTSLQRTGPAQPAIEMIPREILKKIRQIELRTHRLVSETPGA